MGRIIGKKEARDRINSSFLTFVFLKQWWKQLQLMLSQ